MCEVLSIFFGLNVGDSWRVSACCVCLIVFRFWLFEWEPLDICVCRHLLSMMRVVVTAGIMHGLFLDPLRHASNLCGPFLRIVQIAVLLGPHEGATTHNLFCPGVAPGAGAVERSEESVGS